MTRSLWVQSDDVGIAVRTRGDAERPTVVLVHGFPDCSRVWEPVAAKLVDRYHVVTYDVRGAGESDAPARTADYKLEKLAGDLRAVVDATCPERRFHLVAHDWGSIQSWEPVTAADMQARIASYTSISGPCLDHAGYWMRRRMLRPTPRNLMQLVGQLLKSWYIYMFHFPWVAPLLWRHVLGKRWHLMLRQLEGVETEPSPTRLKDGYHAIKLYRANIFPRTLFPRKRYATMPVQVIVPLKDRYVHPGFTEELQQWAPNLLRRDIDAHHWVLLSQPDVIARLVSEFVDSVENQPADMQQRAS